MKNHSVLCFGVLSFILSFFVSVNIASAAVQLWVASDRSELTGTGTAAITVIDTDNNDFTHPLFAPVLMDQIVRYKIHGFDVSPDSSRVAVLQEIVPNMSPAWTNWNSFLFDTDLSNGSPYLTAFYGATTDGDVVFSPTTTPALEFYYAAPDLPTATPWRISRMQTDPLLYSTTPDTIDLELVMKNIAVSSNGEHVYVNGAGQLFRWYGVRERFQYEGELVEATSTSSGEDIAVSPDDTKIFITDEAADQVHVRDAVDLHLITSITVGDAPVAIKKHPITGLLYVVNRGSGTVSVIDASTESIVRTITLPAGTVPQKITFAPDGSTSYVLHSKQDTDGETKVLVLDAPLDTLARTIDLPTVWDSHAFVAIDRLYTPVGENLTVSPRPGLWVTYAAVATSGSTIASTTQTLPELPYNYNLFDGTLYFDLSTTANWSGTSTICMHYNNGDLPDVSNVKFLHKENGSWVDRTSSHDQNMSIICGEITSFSPIAVAELITDAIMPITIDIRPNMDDNKINLGSNGSVMVALLGSTTFDIEDIDLGTVRFAGATISQKKNGDYRVLIKDVDKDGRKDLVARFDIDAMTLSWIDNHASVIGELQGGQVFRGTGTVLVSHNPNEPESN